MQFTDAMNKSEYIISINTDSKAPIFKLANCGLIGDLYEIIPRLLDRINQEVGVSKMSYKKVTKADYEMIKFIIKDNERVLYGHSISSDYGHDELNTVQSMP